MYKYQLFDLDGTLTDPREGITKSVQYALRHYGIEEPELRKLEVFIGPPLIHSFQKYYDFSPEQAREAVGVYREYFGPVGIFQNRVLDGIPEMLEALRENGRVLAVASSKPEYYVRLILEKYELMKYFTVVTGATMDEKRTDKREVIEETLLRLGLADLPGELDEAPDRSPIIMAGDREHDIRGAAACGIDSLGVYTGYARPGELEAAGATHIAHSVEEMREILLA